MNKKLREARLERRYSIVEMSAKLGFKSPSGYAHLEYGSSRMTVDYAKKIAEILDVDPAELFFS
ncbi:helix-turn-helix transcriptional regulator [Bacillus sp. FSL W7-1360]